MAGFAEELRRLFAAAGDPTLKSVSDGALARCEKHKIKVRGSLVSRLSDWRSGKHIPREFEGVLTQVLLELLERADKRGALDGIPARLTQWHTLWRRAHDDDQPAAPAEIACPYPGLAPYGPDDASRFFGRDRAIAEVSGMVFAAIRAGGGLVSVVGVSGSGKSSLLAAGVTPALRERDLRVVAMSPGEAPGDQLDRILTAHRAAGESRALVIVVDQAEEVATVADEAQAHDFLERLAAVTAGGDGGPVVALIGLRADFVGDWLAFPALLGAMNKHAHMLGPMSRAELEQAIVGPAAAVGVKFEPGLTQRLIAELVGPDSGDYDAGALPLLSHALATIWRHRSGNQLTVAGYEAAGGVRGALDDTAEGMWAQLTDGQQTAARRILLRLVYLGDRTRDARATRPRAALLAGDPDTLPDRVAVLDALRAARLVTVDGDDRVTLAHEVLIGSWTRLHDWVETDRGDLLERQRLETVAETWADGARDPSLLVRGSQLGRAVQARSSGEISPLAGAFVDASERTERRAARLRSIAIGALAVVTVVALVLSIAAYQARSRARDAQRSAELGRLTAEADRLRLTAPTISARLALLADHLNSTEETRSRLVVAENLPLAVPIGSDAGAIYSLDVAPDGHRVAAAGSDAQVRIWDIGDRTDGIGEPILLPGHDSFVTSVAWSPDGSRLASTSDDGTIGLWTAPGSPGSTPQLLRGHDGRVVYAAWSPDGARLATAGMDGTVRVWDTADGRQLAELDGHDADVRIVAWSPDGRLIASGSADRTARLWSADGYREVGVIRGHTNLVHALDFSADSRLLATGSDDATVRLWDVDDPAAPRALGLPLTRHTGPVWSVDFSADGRRLVSSSVDGTARLWSVVDPAVPVQVGPTLEGAASSLFSAAFTPDGSEVVTAGADGVVRLWSPPSTVLEGHTGRVIAPSVVGDRMLTGSSDGTVNLWDLRDPTRPQLLDVTATGRRARIDQVSLSADGRLAALATGARTVEVLPISGDGHFGRAQAIEVAALDQHRAVFGPDGRTLLTSGDDDAVRLWSVADDGRATPLGPPLVHGDGGSWTTAAVWSPDGRQVMTAGADRTLNLWDVSDPAAPRRVAESPEHHVGTINALAWSADGTTVASGGDEGEVRLWTVGDGELRPLAVRRHERGSTVRTLEFTAGGDRLISAGDGQSLLIWDTSQPRSARTLGDPIGVLGQGRWYATAMADGSVVIAGGDYGSLVVSSLNPDYVRTRICEHTLPMDEDTWSRYVPAGLGRPDPCP